MEELSTNILRKKILFLSTWDANGGASELTFRMAKALINTPFHAVMFVQHKVSKEEFVHVISPQKKTKPYHQRLINRLKKIFRIQASLLKAKPEYVFFPDEDESKKYTTADEILSQIPFTPDYIISGLTHGFINTNVLKELQHKTGAKTYLIMYDISLVTGGCHIANNCCLFIEKCNNCPAIQESTLKFFPKKNLEIKLKNIHATNIGLLVSHGWTKYIADQSTLFKNGIKKHFAIPLDLNLFTNTNRDIAKRIFNLDEKRFVIFSGSANLSDKRKGVKYFIESLNILWDKVDEAIRKNIIILMAGDFVSSRELKQQIKFELHFLEFIKDYRLLSIAYQASSVFINPSLEDGGPMMVAESLACGTPVVGFKMGLLYDDSIIQDGHNGYRVDIKDINQLAEAIFKIIALTDIDFNQVSNNARETALKEFSYQEFIHHFKKL
jgi:glycosyltransferase involved in cell wall biosynthesis